jgi:hypothetical protein
MTYRKWTNQDKEFIRDNVATMSDDELALRLSQITNTTVSVAMIRTQRRRLGIKKRQGRQAKTINVNTRVFTDSGSVIVSDSAQN